MVKHSLLPKHKEYIALIATYRKFAESLYGCGCGCKDVGLGMGKDEVNPAAKQQVDKQVDWPAGKHAGKTAAKTSKNLTLRELLSILCNGRQVGSLRLLPSTYSIGYLG